jgi:hypothetical protein
VPEYAKIPGTLKSFYDQQRNEVAGGLLKTPYSINCSGSKSHFKPKTDNIMEKGPQNSNFKAVLMNYIHHQAGKSIFISVLMNVFHRQAGKSLFISAPLVV